MSSDIAGLIARQQSMKESSGDSRSGSQEAVSHGDFGSPQGNAYNFPPLFSDSKLPMLGESPGLDSIIALQSVDRSGIMGVITADGGALSDNPFEKAFNVTLSPVSSIEGGLSEINISKGNPGFDIGKFGVPSQGNLGTPMGKSGGGQGH